jgi:prefoldin subunit 5
MKEGITMTTPIINEALAQRAKENMSFSGYKPGSATAEFNQEIAQVTAAIEKAKAHVSPEAQERLDHLLASYTSRYATWTNNMNRNGASHVSAMISGPSGFNHRQHEKYLSREGKLWGEYDELKDIYNRIESIMVGDRIIKSSDANAIEKLETKLAELQKLQENMKAANTVLRNKKLTDAEKVEQLIAVGFSESSANELLKPDFCGRIGFSYHLTNNNGNMRNVKDRIEKLKRAQAQGTKETIIESAESETEGIRIVDNVEAARLQIFFPGKPDAETRTKLKKNGFRWTPSIGAWQSYRSERANRAAKEIVSAM